MGHDELRKIVEAGLGNPVSFDARPVLGSFIKNRATKIALRYDWIKNPEFYRITYYHPEIEIGDGQEWITVWIIDAGSQMPGGVG